MGEALCQGQSQAGTAFTDQSAVILQPEGKGQGGGAKRGGGDAKEQKQQQCRNPVHESP